MTKIITVLTIALFSLGIQAQEAKPAAKKQATTKTMSKADIEKCKAKCKAEGKTCDKDKPKKGKKSCCAKA
ncbi:hypothetical protein GKZ90_0024105 [Flavobacterium sp. MC2016-06]|jgi:hypothetical protein|uniref:hypothetical protein n=1 Tax=Flavobacterium sp. MC2016-06 TaxID=2676308 RepID=UPI0012BAA7B7|nr:hypothetical protein [Flavobacterium sp. MC2016-06]MBU3861838.1 hypothetical protein [Flavobacterium sp. MC2016-06]